MPSELRFEPHSPRYSPSLVWGCLWPNCTDSVAFWRLFGAFLGHVVELEGTKGLFDISKSSRMRSVPTFLRSAVLNRFFLRSAVIAVGPGPPKQGSSRPCAQMPKWPNGNTTSLNCRCHNGVCNGFQCRLGTALTQSLEPRHTHSCWEPCYLHNCKELGTQPP